MEITKEIWGTKKVVKKGDGLSQLDEYIGHPKKGDIVQIMMNAKVESTGKELEDTYFDMRFISIEIGSDYNAGVNLSPYSWTKGLAMALEGMVLGDECLLHIKSDYAYGAEGKKCKLGTVGPNEDIMVKVSLRKINGHHRKIAEQSCCELFMKCNWGWNTMT
uniref:peptidylprolyl isomerase n=1 Tax=Helicotheca tamesis TaxID=374047 RepID=A0A7S2ML66_9STRA|mmetsp:Transcript_17661/g.24332  ORF Transcript_17661/g.24332 Transcript_17661/m.24332 type:complete len:162 (+) Transcript_17661:58-543(+)|eukprot:CAMPEP_0185723826 /NCGR_PEP_ID=MMETSP1171-20130828/536_1 /TAXON_ID=374046 /ORGANISM="Helicotheca tamensis, Strain CCMP826" /LENGTH=161 /DNA_ID=CAMNT_0028391581 /DNA_START=47 /DNA_END=532 /DNA_ORIENTATION=+